MNSQAVKWDEADPLQHLTRPKPAGISPQGVKSDAYAPPDIMAIHVTTTELRI